MDQILPALHLQLVVHEASVATGPVLPVAVIGVTLGSPHWVIRRRCRSSRAACAVVLVRGLLPLCRLMMLLLHHCRRSSSISTVLLRRTIPHWYDRPLAIAQHPFHLCRHRRDREEISYLLFSSMAMDLLGSRTQEITVIIRFEDD
jgi:hypothetical protein